MKWIGLVTMCALLWSGCSSASKSESKPEFLHQVVNPFIGTGGHGHTYPGATRPFGMVQLSPDSRLEGWDGCGGYHFSDDTLFGFSHTHLQGTGVSDYGDILLMPCTQFQPGNKWRDRYKSHFSHERESAHAGYYAVHLDDHDVDVQLTATERVGIHSYALNGQDSLTLIVDLDHRDELVSYSIYPLDDTTLVGHRVSDNWAQEQHVYFAARFNHPFEWLDALSEMELQGRDADGNLLQELTYVPVFAAAFGVVDTLVSRVALSLVDIEGALANLNLEAPHNHFDQYVQNAEEAWDTQLGRIQIDGASHDELEVFYTAWYHSCTTPNVASDVDGRYRGMDKGIHQLPTGETHYTIFSLWDTFRALHPLLNWIEPQRSRDFIQTFLRMYKEGGQLPVWELASNYTGCMIGYHSVPVIQDAWTWGIREFDTSTALEAMVQSAERPELGIPAYIRHGYIPMEEEHESVSKTLEYAYDDACIAKFADATSGDSLLIERFQRRALSYRNLFNPESNFIQPKRGASWLEDFHPTEVNFNYTEANGWQYNFFAPHDIAGHMELMGGDSVYLSMLLEMFEANSTTTGRQQADITGLIGQYAHGNEPSHHMAYLFNHVGRPDLTAKYVDEILSTLYTPEPDGLSGNEDCGQMSAWYVWSAMGMYPVNPGSDIVELGVPRFEQITIHPVGEENATIIQNRGQGACVQGVSWEGQAQPSFVRKADLIRGGVLAFQKGSAPSEWGRDADSRPVHRQASRGFVPVPNVQSPRVFYGEKCTLELKAPTKDCHVEFRILDGDDIFQLYTEPLSFSRSIHIEARTIASDGSRSAPIRHAVRKVPHAHQLTAITEYDHQYAAGGDQALVDGIIGPPNFKTGDWQGTFGQDVEATIDLEPGCSIDAIRLGALRDTRPWIFLPQSVSLDFSDDGVNWRSGVILSHEVPNEEEDVLVHRFEWDPPRPIHANHLRMRAKSYGNLPKGHLGAGNPSWMFLDELEIDCHEH